MSNINLIASKRNWIDSRSVETLEKLTTGKGVEYVVGLPDLSVGRVPNGMALMSKDRIYPHLIGGDIGCGMSLFQTSIKAKKIKVDKFRKHLSSLDSLDDITLEKEALGYHLGSIGKGNHFAELHLVESVKDESLFQRLGLSKQALFTLVHSGSRAYGQSVFDKVAGTYNPNEGLDIRSLEARNYLELHNKAVAYAKESREEIVIRLMKAIKIDIPFNKVSDTAHNSITCKEGRWLHRKGATPTNEGAVIIAGSRGSLSYLVMPTENTKVSNYSLSHGAGRKWERSSAEAKLRNRYTKEALKRTQIGSHVLCKDSKLLYEEAPEVYKNIDIVIDDLVDAELATVIATFKPILTYKE